MDAKRAEEISFRRTSISARMSVNEEPSVGAGVSSGSLNRLSSLFRNAVGAQAHRSSIPTVLLSGGLDSSLVAWTLRPMTTRATTLVIGVEGARDRVAAREASALLGLPLHESLVGPEEIRSALSVAAEELRHLDYPHRAVAVAATIALLHAQTELLFCGQGADELFLGYAHFRRLDAASARRRQLLDWSVLVDREWPRLERIAASLGKVICSPYLDAAFSREALALPVEVHLPGATVKPVLRDLAGAMGLPELLRNRPKRAWQYGSGVDRLLRTIDSSPAPGAAH